MKRQNGRENVQYKIRQVFMRSVLMVTVLLCGCSVAPGQGGVSNNRSEGAGDGQTYNELVSVSDNVSDNGTESVSGNEAILSRYESVISPMPPQVEVDRVMTEGQRVEDSSVTVPVYEMARRELPATEAMAFAEAMHSGWNLGNTFDAVTEGEVSGAGLALETSWCGAITTRDVIDAVAAAGYRTIRIPVSWHNHVSGPDFEIADSWMDRVQEVVDYAYANGLYVIINVHHDIDKDYYYPSSEYLDSSTHYMECIWAQIAARFQNYGERLIFESVNEPRLVGTSYEWNMTAGNAQCEDAVACINALNQTFVDVVRRSGGNNAERYLMVPGYAASVDGALHEEFVLPLDSAENRLMVSTHAYSPYDFALQAPNGENAAFTDAGVGTVDWIMNALYERYVSRGIPVVMGEFGARDKDNLQDRINFTAYYVATAWAHGIPCLWWDNNAFEGDGELFGLLNRNRLEWTYWDLVNAMMSQLP